VLSGIYQEADKWQTDLAFVAVRALFGIEFIRRHAKDVVALNADAMDVA
jgi:hypothetical protein